MSHHSAEQDYELLSPLAQPVVHVRFRGVFEHKTTIWDAYIYSLAAYAKEKRTLGDPRYPLRPFIDVGELTNVGRRINIGLALDKIEQPTIIKTMIMIRQYKRLRAGRHEFGEPHITTDTRKLMPRLVSISRAARLVGVPRGSLQARIQQGEIGSFEGQVSLTELARAYPDTQFEDNSMLERIEQIIEDAAKHARVRAIKGTPDLDTLAARVTLLSEELLEVNLTNSAYLTIFDKLKYNLQKSAQTHSAAAPLLLELREWLVTELQAAAQQQSKPASLLAADTLLSIMAAQVQLRPSGHEFLIEGNNSILESGLSAGLALNYGCSNGNCGKCMARVISGQVKKIRPHDHVLSEVDKSRGCILTCSYTAVTDIVLEADEAENVNDIPQQSIHAWIRKVTPVNDTIKILNIKTPRTQRLRFLAGQTVKLSMAEIGELTLHIASCPCDDMNLQFHLRRDTNNPLVQHLFGKIDPNEPITLDGPQGQFVLREDMPHPLVFVAFNHGFAPIKGLIEHAMTLDSAQLIHLYWIVAQPVDLYLENQCRAWADALETFRYTPIVIAADATHSAAAFLQQLQLDHAQNRDLHFYIAGNGDGVSATHAALLNQGIKPEAIRCEAL